MQNEYSMIKISIPKVKQAFQQNRTYVYEIAISTRWGKWHLQKTYADFQELHRQLQNDFNGLPEFPSTIAHYLLREAKNVLADKEILETYLQKTSLRSDIINTPYYAQFLQLPKNSKALLANEVKFDGEIQLGEQVDGKILGDAGKIIVDMHYTEDYIVIATGNNSKVEKFSAVLSNTKFPWDGEEKQFIVPLGTAEYWVCKKKPYGYKKLWARNYPHETTSLIFNIQAELMVVGLADGSIEFLRLLPQNFSVYHEVINLVKVYEDPVVGLHLDPLNCILYSSSSSGFLAMNQTKNGTLIDSAEFESEIVGMFGDSDNMRLFLSLGEGVISIVSYNSKGKTKVLKNLSPPDNGAMKTLIFDKIKNYLFIGSYDSGNIFIYQVGKPGYQKLTKQIGILTNKQKVISLHWNALKMELIAGTEGGGIFFWNCLEGKPIYMLKALCGETSLATTRFIEKNKLLISCEKEKMIKFWRVPSQWKDLSVQRQEQREIEIRRKVENLHKVREAIKKKEEDSDDDDLACWFVSESSDEEQEDFNILNQLK